jgi:hypothetical protein
LKLAVRLTYELGAHLASKQAGHDQAGQDGVANRIVQVCLEELQRATLEGMLRAGLNELESVLNGLLTAGGQSWAACQAERLALADKFDSAPAELFTADAMPFWLDVAKAGAAVVAKVNASPGLVRTCSVVWCGAQLAKTATQRVSQAEAHVSLIGTPPRIAVAAFSGPLSDVPPDPILNEIRATLTAAGHSVGSSLGYPDLVLYLTDAAVVALLSKHNAPWSRSSITCSDPLRPIWHRWLA